MSVDPHVEALEPQQCGVSPAALHAARAIFRLDGMAAYRATLHDTSYGQCANVADLARAVDREWRHTMPLDWLQGS